MKKSGFTLIEILVTVSIIGLLTMIGLTNFRVANQKARDGRRQGDLEQIKAALELYRTDEAEYPTDISSGTIQSPTGTVYMNEVPTDPISTREYYYSSDSDTYTLCAALELDLSGACGGNSCGIDVTCNYQVTSPL
ncbi:prepilin-type N-terminal cleavage/methylation domain-containing protein [Patescibacteria group bacterium]|nr:prepilin-type N-terminal cleavage/methylation domain-containing protein [Patescibacteria group bacterium]